MLHHHSRQDESDPEDFDEIRCLVEEHHAEDDRRHGKQCEKYGESAHRNHAKHRLLDSIADGIGEQTDEDTECDQVGSRPSGPAHRCTEWSDDHCPDHESDTEPGKTAIKSSDSCSDHDVCGPTCGGQEDEEEPERLVAELDARQHHDTDCRKQKCNGVALRACGECSNTDGADELDRHSLAHVESFDGEVEGEVHESNGDTEDRCRGKLCFRPHALRQQSG